MLLACALILLLNSQIYETFPSGLPATGRVHVLYIHGMVGNMPVQKLQVCIQSEATASCWPQLIVLLTFTMCKITEQKRKPMHSPIFSYLQHDA